MCAFHTKTRSCCRLNPGSTDIVPRLIRISRLLCSSESRAASLKAAPPARRSPSPTELPRRLVRRPQHVELQPARLRGAIKASGPPGNHSPGGPAPATAGSPQPPGGQEAGSRREHGGKGGKTEERAFKAETVGTSGARTGRGCLERPEGQLCPPIPEGCF